MTDQGLGLKVKLIENEKINYFIKKKLNIKIIIKRNQHEQKCLSTKMANRAKKTLRAKESSCNFIFLQI